MGKELELARTATSGAVHLIIGKILSRVVGVLGGLVLVRLLGPVEYGLLNVAVVAPGVFGLFSDFGVSAAMTKYLAEFKSSGKANIRSLWFSGLALRVSLSVGLTILCYVSADTFSMLIGKPYAASLIRAASLLILAWALYGLSEAIFLGLDATRAYAGLMLLHEFLKAVLPIVLVISGMGVFGALFGMTMAVLIAGFCGVLVSALIALRIGRSSSETLGYTSNFKRILRYGGPLAVSSMIKNAIGQYYGLMIATYIGDYEIGNYNAAQKLVSPISYLALPIVSVMFPAFAKINPKREHVVLKKIFKYSVKYSSLLVLPTVVLMIVLARPLTVVLFGVEFENAWIYFALLASKSLSYGFGGAHLKRLLMAQGETTFIAKLEALSAAIGVGLGLVLIPSYGVLGLILILLAVSWPSYVLAVKKVYKSYGVVPPFRDVWKLYVSLAIMALAVIPLAVTPIDDVLKVVIGGVVGLIAFFVAIPITRAIKEGEIKALTNLMKPQPIIGKIAGKILRVMQRISNFT